MARSDGSVDAVTMPPGITNLGVDQIAVRLPVGIARSAEQVSDLDPGVPSQRAGRNQPCPRAAGNGDRDLLTGLYPSYESRGVLTKLA